MASSDLLVINTLEHGLSFHTVDELKKLLDLLPTSVKKTRKAELIEAIASMRHFFTATSLGSSSRG